VRGIKNELNLKLQALEMAAAPFEEYEKLAAGSLRRASKEGDVVTGSVMAGQSSALVKDIRPVKAIIEGLFEEAKAVVNEKAKLFNQ
jgi:enoyl-[acyl-carrier protein] reductase II